MSAIKILLNVLTVLSDQISVDCPDQFSSLIGENVNKLTDSDLMIIFKHCDASRETMLPIVIRSITGYFATDDTIKQKSDVKWGDTICSDEEKEKDDFFTNILDSSSNRDDEFLQTIADLKKQLAESDQKLAACEQKLAESKNNHRVWESGPTPAESAGVSKKEVAQRPVIANHNKANHNKTRRTFKKFINLKPEKEKSKASEYAVFMLINGSQRNPLAKDNWCLIESDAKFKLFKGWKFWKSGPWMNYVSSKTSMFQHSILTTKFGTDSTNPDMWTHYLRTNNVFDGDVDDYEEYLCHPKPNQNLRKFRHYSMYDAYVEIVIEYQGTLQGTIEKARMDEIRDAEENAS
jgi:hypothetical protein